MKPDYIIKGQEIYLTPRGSNLDGLIRQFESEMLGSVAKRIFSEYAKTDAEIIEDYLNNPPSVEAQLLARYRPRDNTIHPMWDYSYNKSSFALWDEIITLDNGTVINIKPNMVLTQFPRTDDHIFKLKEGLRDG